MALAISGVVYIPVGLPVSSKPSLNNLLWKNSPWCCCAAICLRLFVDGTPFAIASAGDLNTKLPISNLIYSMFEALVDNGNSNDDHSALYKEIERINKFK